MEHITQCDWLSSRANTVQFLTESDLDNSVIEKILHNRFVDPLLSSDSENENETIIDWDKIFALSAKYKKNHMKFVPGFRQIPPYPRVSSLSKNQHFSCLKVLCEKHPEILEAEHVPLPSRRDFKVFEEVREKYEKEMEEYKEWAKTMWANGHKMRVLRPHPTVEMVYEAELKHKAYEMSSFPTTFQMAAQIPLTITEYLGACELEYDKELISVDIKRLPQIVCPDLKEKYSIIRPCHTPEPCPKHPCKFILPGEDSTTVLPFVEVHRELAQFAADHDSQMIVSETALKCLVEHDRHWSLPITVSQAIGCDGEMRNVMVIGSEFSDTRQPSQTRTYRAFRHLLESGLTMLGRSHYSENKNNSTMEAKKKVFSCDVVTLDSSSDEEDNLLIDGGEDLDNEMKLDFKKEELESLDGEADEANLGNDQTDTANVSADIFYNSIGSYKCTCKGTEFERPPPRSYKRWILNNLATNCKYSVIVHCSQKVRDKEDVVVLQPIPEYQIDLGGCEPSQDRIRGLLLSLVLRRNACLLNVRIDAVTGETVTFEKCHYEQFLCTHSAALSSAAAALHCSLSRLHGLLPGHYLLRHEVSHGSNAMLYVSCAGGAGGGDALRLRWDAAAACDEADAARQPPRLCDVLLPIHKFRKILPCAFTPNELQVAKEKKKQSAKTKVPPAAIKWPKKKNKRKK